jgi:hypothetical protein
MTQRLGERAAGLAMRHQGVRLVANGEKAPMTKDHGEPEDYIGPHEEGEEHPLGHMEEATNLEAEEYVGPLPAEDVEGEPKEA